MWLFSLQFVDLMYKKQLSWSVETFEQTIIHLKSMLLLLYIISILHPLMDEIYSKLDSLLGENCFSNLLVMAPFLKPTVM